MVLAVAATTPLLARLSAQDSGRDDKGALAVLRRDGVLLPFASFDRDSWEITWPMSFRDIKVPRALDEIPEKWWGKGAPKGWRAYTVSGKAIDLSLLSVGAFRPFCIDRIGLATSYKSSEPLPPKPVHPFPKDGIAVSGNVPIDTIETVNPASPEARALVEQLAKHFEQAERRTIMQVRANTGWKHRFNDQDRTVIPIRLESWYRSPSSEAGWTVSYIEASRAYPPGPEDNGCGLETFVSGWMHHNRGELGKNTVLSAKLTYCDRVGVVYMLPFGRIRPRTRDYWIFQLSGWEAEWYDVAEVGREKIRHVIEMNAGGCRF